MDLAVVGGSESLVLSAANCMQAHLSGHVLYWGSTHGDAPKIMLKWALKLEAFQFANTGCMPVTYAIKKGA